MTAAHQRPLVETLEARILHSADLLPLAGADGDVAAASAHQWLQSPSADTAVQVLEAGTTKGNRP